MYLHVCVVCFMYKIKNVPDGIPSGLGGFHITPLTGSTSSFFLFLFVSIVCSSPTFSVIDIQYMYVLYYNYIQTLQRQASEELK